MQDSAEWCRLVQDGTGLHIVQTSAKLCKTVQVDAS